MLPLKLLEQVMQGKGFAVVAEQVRKLAEDSKQAADQINGLIKEIQTEVVTARYNETESTALQLIMVKKHWIILQSNSKVSLRVIQKTDIGINEVIKIIENQDRDISKIAVEVEQINTIIEQSSGTAEELSSSAEEMASTLEEMSAAAEELNSGSEQLFTEIKKV